MKSRNVQQAQKQSTGISSSFMGAINSFSQPLAGLTGRTDKGSYTGSCAKNILIFAKGTMEPTAYGVSVGPVITSGLGFSWTTVPVTYDADIPGDYCLGLPGGMVAKDMINQAARKCPNSNIFVSGYSQGAMVVRNGLAYADPEAKTHVKVSSM
jgi:Cutinase